MTGQEAYSGTEMTGLLKNGYEEAVMLPSGYQENFEERTGIDVSVDQFTEAQTRQNFIIAANDQSDAYNFSVVQHWFYPEYDQNDWLQPLDPYIEDSQADWVNFDIDAIYESVRNVFSTDGTLYGIPHTLISGMLWYRTDVFEELGIDEPETTGDVLQAAETIEESDMDISGIIGRASPAASSLNTWIGWIWGYGGQMLNDENQTSMDTDAFQQGYTDLVTAFRDYGPDGLASSSFTELQPYMVEGDAAMHWGTSAWGSIYNGTEIGDQVKGTLITGPADNTLQWFYGEALQIPRWISTEMKGPAWQFLQWRQSEETALHEMRNQPRLDNPNRLVLESDEYQQFTEEQGLGDFAETLRDSFERLNDEYWPYVPEFSDIGNVFMQETSSAVAGEQSAEEALSNAEEQVRSVLEDAGYYE
jgi:ABC-type glycerol-3-phosphate transport system substrate-binding protein